MPNGQWGRIRNHGHGDNHVYTIKCNNSTGYLPITNDGWLLSKYSCS